MSNIDKIRQEIERRLQRENEILWNAKKRGTYPSPSCEYNLLTLTSLRDFIDSLQQEPKWKPLPESLEALLYAIEGKWDAIKPTSYLSRRLEDLYEGLVNTFNVDESLLAELPKVASRVYTAEDIEELRALKDKIEASMEQEHPSEELDEAARLYAIPHYMKDIDVNYIEEYPYDSGLEAAFIAGAEWLKGQMMKEAVEGYVNYYEDGGGKLMAEAQVGCPYHIGDKVKIVIVKEDKE